MTELSNKDLLAEISRLLLYHESLGIKECPRTKLLERFLQKQENAPAAPLEITSQPRKMKLTQALAKKHLFDPCLSQKATLQDVMEELGDCRRCSLHTTRTNIVFGRGPETARLVIVTDAPGIEDDRQGVPVQGEPGELLDKMLGAIGLSRSGVYITSLVKCFPGPGGKPGAHEIKTCLPFLLRQIEIICPTVICTMGLLAAQTLLHSGESLFRLRGRFYNFNDLCSGTMGNEIVLMPSLHPSLLLENSELKKASWQDLQVIQKKLEKN